MPLPSLPVSWSTVSYVLQTLPDIGSVSEVTSADIALFLGKAQAIGEAKLARRYAMPLLEDYPVLQAVTTDIAIYLLLVQRLFTAERLNASPWPDRYKEAVDTLDQLASGALALVSSSGVVLGASADAAPVVSTTQGFHPTHWEGPWEEHLVDVDKADRERSRRGL